LRDAVVVTVAVVAIDRMDRTVTVFGPIGRNRAPWRRGWPAPIVCTAV
jgi:hypothetical protein